MVIDDHSLLFVVLLLLNYKYAFPSQYFIFADCQAHYRYHSLVTYVTMMRFTFSPASLLFDSHEWYCEGGRRCSDSHIEKLKRLVRHYVIMTILIYYHLFHASKSELNMLVIAKKIDFWWTRFLGKSIFWEPCSLPICVDVLVRVANALYEKLWTTSECSRSRYRLRNLSVSLTLSVHRIVYDLHWNHSMGLWFSVLALHSLRYCTAVLISFVRS
jgi:hypothetical protein